jgi:ketol-acid reductoisomerase
MVKIYHDKDGNFEDLRGKTIAIIGYGNQGRAQALNLRDNGLKVIIGNKKDNYMKIAEKDGFKVYPISVAVSKSNIIFILLPDEIMKEIYEMEIEPNLKNGYTLCFASGYNIAFGLIRPPLCIDILMIAPRMIGVGVRENFLLKKGFFSFICVHQDFTGSAKKTLLALSKGIGTLLKGGIEIDVKTEAILDLSTEQMFGPTLGRAMLTYIYTLIDAGYPPEAVLVELYMSGEMSYTFQKMADIGLIKQVDFHSQTSQYGSMSRGIRFRKLPLRDKYEQILKELENGDFAKEWEGKLAKLKFKFIKFFATKQKIAKFEKQVRKNLDLKKIDIYKEEPPSIENLKEKEKLLEELKEFQEFYDY